MIAGSGQPGDDAFSSYFVIQNPEMLDRYERHVGPGAAATDLADQYPLATLTFVDDAGHALPREQPEMPRTVVAVWLTRVERRAS